MTNTFREYARQRDLQEYGGGGGPSLGANPNPVAAGHTLERDVAAAKKALGADLSDPKVAKELADAEKNLTTAKAEKDRQKVTQLVQELDPATQGKPGMQPPTAMMKKRMKK